MDDPAPARDDRETVVGPPGETVIEHTRLRQRRARAPQAPTITLAMTSMIDVVFLLLIYFLVASDFRMGEEVYRLDLPSREGAGHSDPFKLDDEPLRIAVISTGLGPDMYRLRLDGPYPQPASFDELFQFLTNKQVNEFTSGGGGGGALFQPHHPVIIQPTRLTRWDHAMEAFNAAARARYTNITFAKPG
jgi:biopolymer transport protein ExbD